MSPLVQSYSHSPKNYAWNLWVEILMSLKSGSEALPWYFEI